MSYALLGDDNLLYAFKQGEVGAFEEIYKRYCFKLYCIAYKQTSSQHESEEIVQNLFVKIWNNRETSVIKDLGPYLVISLRNMIIDYIRKKVSERKLKASIDISEATNSTEDELNRAQLLNTIENVLEELPEKTREVFKLSRYEHKSVREIAGLLDLTEKAVEYHITKSIKLLRQYLKTYLGALVLLLQLPAGLAGKAENRAPENAICRTEAIRLYSCKVLPGKKLAKLPIIFSGALGDEALSASIIYRRHSLKFTT
ncbi:RNA polymerase sigma-70 factor [Paraflavisolibacter sp. H34]|uniref:RNA polymerase sigma-70 factor n=1 Tax=Huijunlia imazamoxiresistens TaxID=3127457 RepID=UPI003016C046